MENGSAKASRSGRLRAAAKLAVTILAIAIVAGVALSVVTDKTINGLVNHLSLALLVGLIVAANLLSLVIGVGLYNVYRSIKQDLDPRKGPEDYGPR